MGYPGGYTQLKEYVRQVRPHAPGYSRLLWMQFYARQTLTTPIRGLESAFEFFGGVPQELLFDQIRAVVLSDERLGGSGLIMNAEFVRFAAHRGVRARACRPYRARLKGGRRALSGG